jgi:type II secretory pathway pseudopilin PulG
MGIGYGGGFTFVEALVSVLVLALVLAAAVPIARSALRALGLLSNDERKLHSIALAYELFRRSCAETRVPPWVSSRKTPSEESGRFTVAYLEGLESKRWTIEASGAFLTVEAYEQRITLEVSEPRILRIESGGRTVGLEARFTSLGRAWTWRGWFGASGY